MNLPSNLSIIDAIILLRGKIELAYKLAYLAGRRSPLMADTAAFMEFEESERIMRCEQRTLGKLFDVISDRTRNGDSEEDVLDSVRIEASRIVSDYKEVERKGHELTREEDARVALLRSILVAAVWGNASLIELQSI